MASEPHSDAQALLEQRAEAPELRTLPLSEARETHRKMSITRGKPESVGAVKNVVVRGDGHGIPVRVYTPKGEGPFPVLVWAHGGGFVLGDIDTEDATARALTNAANCVVASVDYRLAPEHPYPAALRDIRDVVEWARESADDHGGDTNQVAVGGASAGGTLAAATALLARDQGGPKVDYQVLVYPVTAHGQKFPSHEEYSGYLLTKETMRWFANLTFEDKLLANSPYASPLNATEVGELPPATIITAGFDPLQDEGEAYAQKLEDGGVDVVYRHYDDMIHGFFGQLQEPEWERAREAVGDVGADLRVFFG